jgi:hypothetical protein
MTALAATLEPIGYEDLHSIILKLPEKEFWDLVDIRLNRPKGVQIVQEEEDQAVVIIELNGKPSKVERWTESALVDELFLQLATTKSIVSHKGRCGIIVHKYYDQALALRKYIPIAKPAPKFKINLSDLSTRLVAELRCLENPQDVLKQAVGRIFENIDERQYHFSIASKLKVRVEK